MQKGYGFRRQQDDERDLMYATPHPNTPLNIDFDLRPKLPECWDQQRTSSCIVHGEGAAIWCAEGLAEVTPTLYSRLFPYYNLRALEGNTTEDNGGVIRDGIKALNRYGFCPEADWPFDPSKVLVKPPDSIYLQSAPNRIHFYASIDLKNESQIKLALSHGLPVVFGFDVYSYFESQQMEKTGILNFPKFTERQVGGHCTAIVGNLEHEGYWWIRNSWGPRWGPFAGNFKMSKEYVYSNLCADAWVTRIK